MSKYKIGDIVYLMTDEDQKKRIITGYVQRATHRVWILSSGEQESYHYEIEISRDINVLAKL